MSPIFVRPVREQLEHDRLIRFLQARYKRKFEIAINVGEEQAAPVKLGQQTFFPDLVLTEGRRLAGLVEVETGESVNNLEAMAQWVHFARSRVPFHLYVPIQGVDAARRLCAQHNIAVSEIWTYRASMEGFDLVRVFHDPAAGAPARETSRKSAPAGKPAPERVPARRKPAKAAAKPARPSRSAKTTRSSKSARPSARSSRKPARPKKAAASKR